jgi:protein-L-isoaspartate(D-aspartate) O-methyltransferase
LKDIDELIIRLEENGFPMDESLKFAFKNANIDYFIKSGNKRFYSDNPVEFMKTSKGVTKNISAPHMLVTLLHHLEIKKGQKVLLLGSKGGYLAAILDYLLGEEGIITLIEPHEEVLEHTRRVLENHQTKGIIRVLSIIDFDFYDESAKEFDRILITGAVREIPDFLSLNYQEGSFILGPFGGNIQQRLLKKEKQSGEWLDTDLGGVVFSPMDTRISEREPLDPIVLAEGLEDSFSLICEIIEVDEEILQGIEQLIQSLRELPRDIPSIGEHSSDEEIMENPVMDLMMSEMERLAPIWPIIEHFMSIELVNIFNSEDESSFITGGHEDLVP